MTFDEITYMILETVRNNKLTDDENLDKRLIENWVNMKRAQFIKNKLTGGDGRISLNNYQTVQVTLSIGSSYAPNPFYNWPYSTDDVQDKEIVRSTTAIPTIIEGKRGPIVLTIESTDFMKLPFSFVDYDYLRIAGNGRFNSKLIFGAIRDNYLYFKNNDLFEEGLNKVNIRAVFEDPRDVFEFDVKTSRYPCDENLIEYIKNAIFEVDIKTAFSVPSDEKNDSSGDIR